MGILVSECRTYRTRMLRNFFEDVGSAKLVAPNGNATRFITDCRSPTKFNNFFLHSCAWHSPIGQTWNSLVDCRCSQFGRACSFNFDRSWDWNQFHRSSRVEPQDSAVFCCWSPGIWPGIPGAVRRAAGLGGCEWCPKIPAAFAHISIMGQTNGLLNQRTKVYQVFSCFKNHWKLEIRSHHQLQDIWNLVNHIGVLSEIGCLHIWWLFSSS